MAQQIAQQGWGQMTPAVRQTLATVFSTRTRSASSKRRSKSKKAAASSSKRRRASSRRSKRSAKPARLIKGSAAAKRYMAKIRKLRK